MIRVAKNSKRQTPAAGVYSNKLDPSDQWAQAIQEGVKLALAKKK